MLFRRRRSTALSKVAAARSRGLCALLGILLAGSIAAQGRLSGAVIPLRVVGDTIPRPLVKTPGDPERGRALLVERGAANCVLCHAFPDLSPRTAGNVGPSLTGVGARLSAAQLRLRIADIRRVKPDAVMPSYYRVNGLSRVAPEYRGKPVLDAQQIEDLVAYLGTLK